MDITGINSALDKAGVPRNSDGSRISISNAVAGILDSSHSKDFTNRPLSAGDIDEIFDGCDKLYLYIATHLNLLGIVDAPMNGPAQRWITFLLDFDGEDHNSYTIPITIDEAKHITYDIENITKLFSM